jgi:hypothetical protein
MRFNLLVENHLGATRTRAVCQPCAARFPGRLLREPGTGERSAPTERYPNGLPLAGPLVVRESEYGECSECGAGRAPVGYLRCCAFCNVDLLLDHEISNEVPVYCPRHADPAARR